MAPESADPDETISNQSKPKADTAAARSTSRARVAERGQTSRAAASGNYVAFLWLEMCGESAASPGQLNWPQPALSAPTGRGAVRDVTPCLVGPGVQNRGSGPGWSHRVREEGWTVQALLTPFGRNAAYVSAVILLVILILLILAFRQGREIRFWPPKIGLRPEYGKATRATGRNAQRPPSPLGGRPAGVAEVFEVTDAAQFYQAIAPNYDQRNSVNLLATHLEVIARLDKLRKAKPALRVLDLGGGTGQNVATHFFSDPYLRWTYVDSCPAMLSQLRQHLAGRPL